jgi:phosphocarrier protein HPr
MDIVSPDLGDEERAAGDAVVRDPTGLHARPAVKLTKLAKQFEAAVRVRVGTGLEWVNAKSPNRVMKLKARHGETVVRGRGAGCGRCGARASRAGSAQLR